MKDGVQLSKRNCWSKKNDDMASEAAADGIIQEDNTYAEAGAIVNRDSLSGYLDSSSIARVCLFTVLVETDT